MNKFLKWVAKIVAGLAIIYIALVILVFFFIQPDTYKPIITKAIYKATGRQIIITGKMSLSIFPWPSVTANKILIPNPKGFKAPKSAPYFAKINTLQVRLFILPLIKGDIRPAKLLLSGATVNLITSTSGKNNWTGFIGTNAAPLKLESKPKNKNPGKKIASVTATSTSPSTPAKTANEDFPILFISETNVHFINERTKQQTDLLNLGLRTKRIGNGNKRLLEMSCMIHHKNPETLVRFNTESTITIDKGEHDYTFDKLKLVTELTKFKNARRPVTLELDGKLRIKKDNFKADFKGLIRQHSGKLTLSIRRNNGLIRVALDVSEMQIEPIISAFSGKTLVQGLLNLNSQVTTRGDTLSAWLNKLSGKGKIQIKNGAIYGLDLNYTIQSALTTLLSGKKWKFAPNDRSKTSFSEISANYLLRNGVLSTNNLKFIGNQIKGDGKGTINFPKETINMRLVTLYEPASKWPIPITITGDLYSPTIQPDTNAIVKQLYKKKLNNEIDKTIKKLKDFNLKKIFE